MEKKIYFTVQDVKRVNCGYKTYTENIENQTYYKEEEIEKAIKHYQKRKANKLIMTCIEYLDDVPYIKEAICFGEEVFGKYENDCFKKYIEFNEFNIKYEI